MKNVILSLMILLSIAPSAISMQAVEGKKVDDITLNNIFFALNKSYELSESGELYLKLLSDAIELEDPSIIDSCLIDIMKNRLNMHRSYHVRQKQADKRLIQMILNPDNFNSDDAMELIISGANPNMIITSPRYPQGTPLLFALADIFQERELLPLLILYGLNPNCKDSNGETALMLAAGYNNSNAMKLLIYKGADINAQSKKGMTALIRASLNNYTECIELLLKHNAEVNILWNGYTALTFAIQFNLFEIVQLLVKQGADIHLGRTRNMLSIHQEDCPEIYQFLCQLYRKTDFPQRIQREADRSDILTTSSENTTDSAPVNMVDEEQENNREMTHSGNNKIVSEQIP